MFRNAVMVWLFASVPITLFFCAYVLQRAKALHARYFFLFSLSASIYAFGYLMEVASSTLEQMVFWNLVQYIALPFLSVLWLCFTLLHSRRVQQIPAWMLAGLLVIPILTFVIRITNSYHQLFYQAMELQQMGEHQLMVLVKGPWYYVHSVYQGVAFIVISAVLVRAYTQDRERQRRRDLLLLASSALPYLGLGLILVDYQGWGWDYAALLLPVSLLLIIIAITKYDFLELRSLARTEIFESAREGLLVIDLDYWVLDYNRAALALFESFQATPLHGDIREALVTNQALLDSVCSHETQEFEGSDGKVYEITTRMIGDRRAVHLGMIKSIVDITERKKTEAALRDMATLDGLSRLYNREYFMQLAGKTFERARRYHEEFSVLMMDLDRFKRINDSRGHAAGDAVIAEIGRLMKERFRKTDVLGRLGGEEFAVVLERISPEEGAKIAEQFRQTVDEAKILYKGEPIDVTISIGVSFYDEDAESFERLLQQADEALYQSKAGGRNRVTIQELRSSTA